MESTLDKALALMSDVERAAGIDIPVSKWPNHVGRLMALYARCMSTFRAIGLLLRSGAHSHEAVILTRPLLTDSLALMEFASVDETRRITLILGWVEAGHSDFDNLFRDVESRGRDVTEARARLAEWRQEAAAYAEKHDVNPRKWKPDSNVKALARKHGRTDEYGSYLMAHWFVHGSMAAVSQWLVAQEDGSFVVGSATGAPQEPWATGAALSACGSILHACRAFRSLLGLPEPDELNALMERAEEEWSDSLDPPADG